MGRVCAGGSPISDNEVDWPDLDNALRRVRAPWQRPQCESLTGRFLDRSSEGDDILGNPLSRVLHYRSQGAIVLN